MINLKFEDVVRVTRAHYKGDKAMGHCPCHDDQNPSLSIKREGEKILVKCFAGCGSEKPYNELLRKLGVGNPNLPKSDVSYTYKSFNGEQALKVVRSYEPKRFYQMNFKNESWVKGGYKDALQPYRYEDWKDSKQVFLVEGEKDVENLINNRVMATTTPGGSNSWKKMYADFFKGMEVIILPDNDDAGRSYAEKALRDIVETASSVIVLELPGLDVGEDVSDWLNKGNDKLGLMKLIDKPEGLSEATIVGGDIEAPLELYRQVEAPKKFPIDCLGSYLGPAIRSVQKCLKAPVEIIVQSALVAMSHSVQGLKKVHIDGRKEMLSLFAITIAQSGERKSSSDNILLQSTRNLQREVKEKYRLELQDYKQKMIIHEDAKKKVLNSRKKSQVKFDLKIELQSLGEEPLPPLTQNMMIEDITVEALEKKLEGGHPSVIQSTSEGGQIFGGYSFNDDNSAKTTGTYTILWDSGGPKSRIRAGGDDMTLDGVALSMHAMVQPRIAAGVLNNETLKDQGFLNRFLMVYPKSTIGYRPYSAGDPAQDPSVQRFLKRVDFFLRKDLPLRSHSRNRLDQGKLELSVEAHQEWVKYYNLIENECRKEGLYFEIQNYAVRSAQQALRIAGCLSMFEDEDQDIPAQTMRDACQISRYYLEEFKRITEGSIANPDLVKAQNLLEFIRDRKCYKKFYLAQIYQKGPQQLRSKELALGALKTLEEHRWIKPIKGGAKLDGKRRRDAWEVCYEI